VEAAEVAGEAGVAAAMGIECSEWTACDAFDPALWKNLHWGAAPLYSQFGEEEVVPIVVGVEKIVWESAQDCTAWTGRSCIRQWAV